MRIKNSGILIPSLLPCLLRCVNAKGDAPGCNFFDHTHTFDITSFQTQIFRLRLAFKEESSNFFHVTESNEGKLLSERNSRVSMVWSRILKCKQGFPEVLGMCLCKCFLYIHSHTLKIWLHILKGNCCSIVVCFGNCSSVLLNPARLHKHDSDWQ